MKSFVIHVADTTEWSPEELLLSLGGRRSGYRDEVVLEKWSEVIFGAPYHDMMTEYEEDEINLIYSLVGNPISYILNWRGERLLEQFLNAVPRNSTVVIDDDAGQIVLLEPGTQIGSFMENMRKQYEEGLKELRKQIEDIKKGD